jgi:hypothetical protein
LAAEGFVSITPVTFEMTNYQTITKMRHLFNK